MASHSSSGLGRAAAASVESGSVPMRDPLGEEPQGYQIAVIGMAGKFPGAADLDAFWKNVADGVESIHFISDEELLSNGETPRNLANPNYVKAWPVLEGFDH